jgi:hypothetical protein
MRTWIFFINTKDEVFIRLKEFKALVENYTRKMIKFLRSENRGEYTANRFKNLCKEEGIKRELKLLSTHNRMRL